MIEVWPRNGGRAVFPCSNNGYDDGRITFHVDACGKHVKFMLFDKGGQIDEQYLTIEEIFSARSILVEVRK